MSTDDNTTNSGFILTTDQSDYAPGSTATITATNVIPGDTIEFVVADVNGTAVSGTNEPWSVTDGGLGDLDGAVDGTIVTTWAVGQDAANEAFEVTATDTASGQIATASFTDAAPPPSPPPLTDGTIFTAQETTSTGTGVINAFVRIEASPTEQGYNTDGTPQYDTKGSPHTHHITLNDIPIVSVGGLDYREFHIDLNESGGSGAPISLDRLQIWAESLPNLTNFDANAADGFGFPTGTMVWNLDSATNGATTVALTDWNAGSGKGDYTIDIPVSFFSTLSGNPYIYLYSQFGNPNGSDGGFEEYYVVSQSNPSIGITKTALVTPDSGVIGSIDSASDDVKYTITITNTGNVDLTNVAVTDQIEGYSSQTLVSPPLAANQSGAGDHTNSILEVGENWTYTINYNVSSADYTRELGDDLSIHNDAAVTAQTNDKDHTPVGGTAFADVPVVSGPAPQASLSIDKTTQDLGNPNGTPNDGDTILTGEAIQWIYTVINTGNVALSDVQVSDSVLGDIDANINTVLTKTGGNQDNLLESGETWTYTLAGTAGTGAYSNTGTASGSSEAGPSSASDESSYFGADPKISIVKTTQDLGNPNGTPNDGDTILTGEAIQWQYTVKNDGNVELTNILVIDDNGTPLNLADDVTVGTILSLAAGASTTLTVDGVAGKGLYENNATATADDVTDSAGHSITPTDDDDSSYTGVYAHLTLDKVTADLGDDDVVDGTPGDGNTILTGENIQWQYTVTNDGNVDLTNIVVVDDNGTADTSDDVAVGTILSLAAGASTTLTVDGVAGKGLYENNATATADDVTDSAGHSITPTDDDDSSYTGVYAHLTLDKVTADLGDDDVVDGTPGDGNTILTGENIQWQYTVTNDGNVDLTNIVVVDDNGTADTSDDVAVGTILSLAAGASTTLTVDGVAGKGLYENNATATADDVTDSAGHSITPTDDDDSSYTGVYAHLTLDKVTADLGDDDVVDGTPGDGNTILTGENIQWQYTVTNDGNVDLTNIVVVDDNGTADTSDDVAVGTILSLAAGASTTLTVDGVAGKGLYENNATATADDVTDSAGHSITPTDDDDSSYTGVYAHLTLDKVTADLGDDAIVDGTPGDGNTILTGENIQWQYTVTNDGYVDLTNIVVVDDNGTADTSDDVTVGTIASLAAGASATLTVNGVAGLGLYENNATATADDVTDSAGHSITPTDDDDSSYFGATPGISIAKSALIVGDADQKIDSTADDITYTIVVTNTGNVDLTDVVVTDKIDGYGTVVLGTPNAHPVGVTVVESGTSDNILEVGETWTYTFVHDVTQADINNNGPVGFKDGGPAAVVSPVGPANGALFFAGTDLPATGSGLIDSFVRLQAKDVEQGYNTDARPYDVANNAGVLDNNAGNTATFNHSIQLGDIPVVNIGNVSYREFHLDLNESNTGGIKNLISLDALKIFSASTGSLSGFNNSTNTFSQSSTLLYNLDGGGDKYVSLTDWSTGSGHGDYAVLIPETAFADLTDSAFIYLYSQFGGKNGTDGGFEEWYVNSPDTLDNTAKVTANFADTAGHTSTDSESATASLTVAYNAALTITKSASTVEHQPNSTDAFVDSVGDVITYTVQVQNIGNATLTGVVLTDQFENYTPVTLTTHAGDTVNPGVLDVGETWTYTYTHTVTQAELDSKGVNGDLLLTNTATVDTDQTHLQSSSVSVDPPAPVVVDNHFNGSAFHEQTAAFWAGHTEAWDGSTATNKWDKLATQTNPTLAKLDVLPNGGIYDANHDGLISALDKGNFDINGNGSIGGNETGIYRVGVLVGDTNGNGITDANEDTLFFDLAAAQQIVGTSDSTTDVRLNLAKQAISAQLNIDNAFQTGTQAKEPLDLIKEAVMWLKGEAPYLPGGSVDTNHDGIAGYNTATKTFAEGIKLASSQTAWTSKVDVVGSSTNHFEAGDWNGGQEVSGSGLNGALTAFNQNQLVVSSDGHSVGWNTGSGVIDVHANEMDNFWLTLHQAAAV